MKYEDSYFLDAKAALEIAKQQNRFNYSSLQICYYAGEKIESSLPNLIHLPFDKFVNNLAQGVDRLPQKIDFTNLDLSEDVRADIVKSFEALLAQAQSLRKAFNEEYLKAVIASDVDFSKPLRFYLQANATTQVMQYVSKAIADSLKFMGYDVFYDLDEGTRDLFCHKNIFLYNPHVVININYLGNQWLGEKRFNFIWFQDPMPLLTNPDIKINLRKRDFVYSLLELFDGFLERKKVPFERQGFCINRDIYRLDKSIAREKKIVFIGSSYSHFIQEDKKYLDALKHIGPLYISGARLDKAFTEEMSEKFDIDYETLDTRFIPAIVRDMGVIRLCEIKSEYTIEIYGSGWDIYESVGAYYKGPLKYGEDIVKVYNSATYTFAPHNLYVLQQRTFEAAACGSIPIVYDCRYKTDEKNYDEALCYYTSMKDVEEILQASTPPKKDFSRLLSENSYDTFVSRILKKVEENL